LSVSKHFVEQFKPGKVVPSYFSDAAAAAVKLSLMREIVTAGQPDGVVRERICQAKLGRLFQIGTTTTSSSPTHQGPKGMRNFQSQ
jgi:hypothetical protein